MKKLGIAVVLAFMLFAGASGAAEPVKLKLSTVVPPTAFAVAKILKPWAEMVSMESEGTVEIEVYGGGVLGRDIKMYLTQIDSGVFDIGFLYPTYMGERFSDLEFVYIPGMAETYVEAALAVQRMFDKGLIRGFEGHETISCFGTSPFYLNTIFPVKTPEDLKGRKCRSVSKVHANVLTLLGMTPVAVPVDKCAESLSRRLIEGSIESPTSHKMFGGYKVCKHHLIMPFGSFALAVVMNKQKYENLPPKAKAAIDKHKGEWFAKFWAETETPYLDELLDEWKKDPERTVLIPTGADLDKWKTAIQPAIDAWKKDFPRGGELLNAYQEELDRIRAGR
ncbi:MAG: TRAP transporter substrate-binding protein DctP [Pseudomonadota bacterium]